MSVDREQLTIATATGVDVSLRLAGAGSRSYAFVIDWHIRLLLAVAWFLALTLLLAGHVAPPTGDPEASGRWALLAVLPALAIYFLYHPLLEVLMRGRTPGKRIAGVRLVTQSGGTPSTGALLIRNVFRVIDALPVCYVVGLVATLVTERRVRIGDLAAGTVLVHDHASALDALADIGSLAGRSSLDPAAIEIVRDLLGRWDSLDVLHREQLSCALLARLDPDADPAYLAALDGHSLRRRLEAQLRGGRLV